VLLPLTVAVVSVALGAGVGLASRGPVPGIQTFAVVSALVVVVGQLLPDATAGWGALGLLPFLAGVALPSVLERVSGRVGRDALWLPFGALLLHKIGDGLGLGAYGGAAHADHHHWDLLLALAAHTVPLTAVMVLLLRRRSLGAALVGASALALASALGVALPHLFHPETLDLLEPGLAGLVAGLLLHVLLHLVPTRSETPLARAAEVLAMLAGLALLLAPGHRHGGAAGGDFDGAVLALAAPVALALLLQRALRRPWLGASVAALGVFGATVGALRLALDALLAPAEADDPWASVPAAVLGVVLGGALLASGGPYAVPVAGVLAVTFVVARPPGVAIAVTPLVAAAPAALALAILALAGARPDALRSPRSLAIPVAAALAFALPPLASPELPRPLGWLVLAAALLWGLVEVWQRGLPATSPPHDGGESSRSAATARSISSSVT
jgi:hypothetical protein